MTAHNPPKTSSRGRYGFDARMAHPARVYDYWLGGKDNFEADRIAGEATIAAYPAIRASARANRADFARPVAIMLLAILHYIPDLDEAQRIVARLVSAIPSGSYLAISHAASDISPEAMAEMIRRMNEHLAEGNHVGRTREVVARFFDGLELLEPGVVKVTEWRPESAMQAEGPTSLWGGVARKP